MPEGGERLTSNFICEGGMDVLWNDPINEFGMQFWMYLEMQTENKLGHSKKHDPTPPWGGGGVNSNFLFGGGMDVFWNDPLN